MEIEGKVAVVAGGASGLGRAVCKLLAGRGARIAVLDRDVQAAQAVAASLDEAFAFEVDVAAAGSVQDAIDATLERFGAVHVNVNTAGIPDGIKIVSKGEPGSLETFERVIAVNLVGTFNVMRLAVAAMLRNEPQDGERGVVVNTASIAAFEGQVGQVAYSASKAGVIGMALPVARDLAGTGVRVNTIAPGLFETPMMNGLPDRVVEQLRSVVLEPPRVGRPQEFAALVAHIVENPYLNAECIRLDAATRMNAR
ncbi:MAG TPA: SDR family NAD(P)-dependent oxidoreductase [Solirubrobacteraceae bacterium]|jgi:NAD(P)-dependent dehydrogenase (short-subunit alcohol dehydrogenase family)|nr:SDR family NAD(P)-dependent oxidoreductase [Solirubrobacteraceae bacterium]